MRKNVVLYKGIRMLLSVMLILAWLLLIRNTDSFFSVYILCAILGFVSINCDKRSAEKAQKRQSVLTLCIAALFSAAVVLANYECFWAKRLAFIRIGTALSVGTYMAYSVLITLVNATSPVRTDAERNTKGKKMFLYMLVAILLIDVVYFFGVAYPGYMTVDNCIQLQQIQTGEYTNHHPFWHTMIIKVCVDLGLGLFHDINIGVAIYSLFSVAVLASTIAYMFASLYTAGVPVAWLAGTGVILLFSPYNIVYSVTMWKDIIFAAAVCAFVTSMFRILRRLGSDRWNYIILEISGIGFGIFRSNGWMALAVTFLVALFLYNQNKKLICFMLIALAISFVLKHLILSMLQIAQPDTIEMLSIPAQQIARVIYNQLPLTADEENWISKLADINEIQARYRSYISDPVKILVRTTNEQYLNEHKLEYLKLWIQIGMKHPKTYLTAWIDQTKGYWNGGYEYWIWVLRAEDNTFGIVNTCYSEVLRKIFHSWFTCYTNNVIFQPFRSIGLHCWLSVCTFYVFLVQRRKEIILSVPTLAIIATLLISTPVFSEFRYAYAVFLTLPVMFLGALFDPLGGQKRYSD